jgi:hypothetical protein
VAKLRRVRWGEHVACIGKWKLYIFGQTNIKMDVEEIVWEDMDWIKLAQDKIP